ncbi:DUF1877 family protein [Micromonospora sp. NPDC049891]|uniref:DUF1877 family protein n=1 Tax=Micromonospora sp. NPDC049891 TaxID=3155655 RepID=UPI0033E7CF9E
MATRGWTSRSARRVAQVRRASDVEPTWLRSRFDAINDPDYLGAHDDADFAYTWDAFTELQAFYDRAAAAGRAVIFTAT